MPAPTSPLQGDSLKQDKGGAADSTAATSNPGGISSEHWQILQQIFNRYDLDSSGTINTANELRQLTTNMVHTNEKLLH